MVDSAKGLPVSHLPKDHQLIWIRHWHEGQIEFQERLKAHKRDYKQIERSGKVILTIDYILSGAVDV